MFQKHFLKDKLLFPFIQIYQTLRDQKIQSTLLQSMFIKLNK